VRHEEFRFEPDPAQLAVLRAELTDLLRAEGWTGADLHAVLLAADELATNAIVHARTPFAVRCTVDRYVEVEVTDGQPQRLPYLRSVVDGQPGGFGLRIVEDIAREWMVERGSSTKTVRMVVERRAERAIIPGRNG
jgi:anti-sigma regulatory factor (Ser/Thr protein kinase)